MGMESMHDLAREKSIEYEHEEMQMELESKYNLGEMQKMINPFAHRN